MTAPSKAGTMCSKAQCTYQYKYHFKAQWERSPVGSTTITLENDYITYIEF